MLILKDYAKYFEQKDRWKRSLDELNNNMHKGMFFLMMLFSCVVVFLK